ncbi:hypothetical protein KVA01_22650 [Kocuria varians]|uniref:Uncharacterized protein n=1 Tax=Kocuria varians TaxID=1272 RepID=A0A4Y4DBH3_KOCVA|nr:hypothetical protein [Kocuria varians]GED00111.1 hypothetical protein KVA01_22650 [Kocuria varians]
MRWRDAVTLDRVPVLTLIVFLLVSWASTVYYLDHAVVTAPSPFTAVWAAYDRTEALQLVTWALVGLVAALVLPLPGRVAPWPTLLGTIGRQVQSLSGLWLLVTFGTMVALVLAKGPYLLHAPQYLMFTAPSAIVSAASVAQPMAVLAAGFLSVRHPVLARTALVLWLVLLFACATRVFAGVLVLYMVGRFLAGGRVSWTTWLITGIVTVVLLPIPLHCRELDDHGLIPYARAMLHLVEDPSFFSRSLLTTASSFGFSVPLLVFTSHATGITASDMLISLNPGPGSLVGWNEIMPRMRVHDFIPYSALGEWASFGGVALMAFTLVWGLVVRSCLRSVGSNPHPTAALFLAAVLGMSMLTVVMITQYNTRAVSRIISVMIALTVLERVLRPWTASVLERWRRRRGAGRTRVSTSRAGASPAGSAGITSARAGSPARNGAGDVRPA